jgi:hypothetical protein
VVVVAAAAAAAGAAAGTGAGVTLLGLDPLAFVSVLLGLGVYPAHQDRVLCYSQGVTCGHGR